MYLAILVYVFLCVAGCRGVLSRSTLLYVIDDIMALILTVHMERIYIARFITWNTYRNKFTTQCHHSEMLTEVS